MSPRSRALARKPKEPVAPVVYEVSHEVQEVMHRLVRLNPVQFGWVNNFKLGGVIVRGARPKEQGGCVVLARFVKVPPLWHGLTGYDAVIRVEDWAWSHLDAMGQEALVTHELCHGAMSDKGSLRVMKHDLEEFGFVVRKYGAWQENIALFDKQLSMFDGAPLSPAPVDGEQTVVPFKRPKPVVNERGWMPARDGVLSNGVEPDDHDAPGLHDDDADDAEAERIAEEDEAQDERDRIREMGEREEAYGRSEADDDPLYAIVATGETLEEALTRIERLDDYQAVIGSAGGQLLLERINLGHGAVVPFPADSKGGAS